MAGLRRTGHAAGGCRALWCACLYDGATHAGDRYPHCLGLDPAGHLRIGGQGDVAAGSDRRAGGVFNQFRDIFEIAPIPPGERGNRVVAIIKRSIAHSAGGDVEGALKYYYEAIRLKRRIKRRRKRRRWLEAGIS